MADRPTLSESEAKLLPFHKELERLAGTGISYDKIVEELNSRGLQTTRSILYKYCTKTGIAKKENEKAKPPLLPGSRGGQSRSPAPAPSIPSFEIGSHVGGFSLTYVPDSPPQHLPPTQSTAPTPAEGYGDKAGELDEWGMDPESLNPRPPFVEPIPKEFKTQWRPPPLPFAPAPSGPLWDGREPILRFGGDGEDEWTQDDACEGAFIIGSPGSGKTSGSGKTIARAFVEAGFGGLVLTVKSDRSNPRQSEELAIWQRHVELAGRADQLCVVRIGGKYRFNFLDYEAHVHGDTYIDNLVDMFYTVLVSQEPRGSEKLASFWENSGKQLLRNIFRVLVACRDRISLAEAGLMVAEAPSTIEEVHAGDWKHSKHFAPWLAAAMRAARGTPRQSAMEVAYRYWLNEFPKLPTDTRSCIVTGFTSLADAFGEPEIHDLFCEDTTLIPDFAGEGAIILIDLPLKKYEMVGRFVQQIWKYCYQKAMERRITPGESEECRRPVFLWLDEAQYLYSTNDILFQSTARSTRCATVYLTQNISAFYAVGSAHRAKFEIDGFLGSFNTKIIHANNDPLSNQWAAELIGRSLQYRATTSYSRETGAPRNLWSALFPSGSAGGSSQPVMDYELQPSEFTTLETGGYRNNGIVGAYFVKSGKRFTTNGKHYIRLTFQQEFE